MDLFQSVGIDSQGTRADRTVGWSTSSNRFNRFTHRVWKGQKISNSKKMFKHPIERFLQQCDQNRNPRKKKTNHLGLICTKQNNENPCSRRRSDYGNYACVISAHCSMSDFSTSFIPPRNIPQFSDLHGHFGIPCPDHEAASRYASRSRRTLGQVELGNDPWFGPSVILCGCPGKRDLRYGEINNVVVSTICRKENCDIGIVCIMYICIILQFMPLYV